MLEVDDLHAYYAKSHILQGVSFRVGAGEIVSLLGRNGAGRSTAVKTLIGLVPPAGSIRFRGERIDGIVRQLDHLAADARTVRGEARADIINRLRVLDDEIVEAAAQEVDAETKAVLHTEADGELAPFAQRMPGAALERARAAAFTRLVRDAIGLPVLTYE